jgi:hypothetical protein
MTEPRYERTIGDEVRRACRCAACDPLRDLDRDDGEQWLSWLDGPEDRQTNTPTG